MHSALMHAASVHASVHIVSSCSSKFCFSLYLVPGRGETYTRLASCHYVPATDADAGVYTLLFLLLRRRLPITPDSALCYPTYPSIWAAISYHVLLSPPSFPLFDFILSSRSFIFLIISRLAGLISSPAPSIIYQITTSFAFLPSFAFVRRCDTAHTHHGPWECRRCIHYSAWVYWVMTRCGELARLVVVFFWHFR